MADFPLSKAEQAAFMVDLQNRLTTLEAKKSALTVETSTIEEPTQKEWEDAWVAAGNSLPIPNGTELLWHSFNKFRGIYGPIESDFTVMARSMFHLTNIRLGYDVENRFLVMGREHGINSPWHLYRVWVDGYAEIQAWADTPVQLSVTYGKPFRVTPDGAYIFMWDNVSKNVSRLDLANEIVTTYSGITGVNYNVYPFIDNNDYILLNHQILHYSTSTVITLASVGIYYEAFPVDLTTEWGLLYRAGGGIGGTVSIRWARFNRVTGALISDELVGSSADWYTSSEFVEALYHFGDDLHNETPDTAKWYGYFGMPTTTGTPYISINKTTFDAQYEGETDLYYRRTIANRLDHRNQSVKYLEDTLSVGAIETELGFERTIIGKSLHNGIHITPDKTRLALSYIDDMDTIPILAKPGVGTTHIRRWSEPAQDDVLLLGENTLRVNLSNTGISIFDTEHNDLANRCDVIEFGAKYQTSAWATDVSFFGMYNAFDPTWPSKWKQSEIYANDTPVTRVVAGGNGINVYGGTQTNYFQAFILGVHDTSKTYTKILYRSWSGNGTSANLRRIHIGMATFEGDLAASSFWPYMLALADNEVGAISFLAGSSFYIRGWRTQGLRGAKHGMA